MLKGTRLLIGSEAENYINEINDFRTAMLDRNFQEVIVPQIWEAEPFLSKISNETKNQIWNFKDKGDRDVCLIPEVTAIIQEMYDSDWSKSQPKPMKLFYVSKCYRYEKHQAGRYREFTQLGVEILGPNPTKYRKECVDILNCLLYDNKYEFKDSVKRGLGYYTEDGFEVECSKLGSQKQVAGGGVYKQGCGFAIGLDRILLAEYM